MINYLTTPLLYSALVVATLGFTGTTVQAQQAQDFADAQIHILPVSGNIYMLVGPIGNSTIQIGDDGVLIIDTQFAALSDRILAAIATLTDKPVRYIINTHSHEDHTGGNGPLALAGSTISGGNVNGDIQDAGMRATIIAHENALFQMLAMKPAPPSQAMPFDTFFQAQKDLYFNGEGVVMHYAPAAHTNGDVFVHFRGSDVISAGDLFVTTTYPFIDSGNGGNIQGILDGLNHIIKIAIPADKQEGGTLIIPGHGRLCDEADIVEFRDMLTIIRDRIKALVDAGMNLAQVQAAKPTSDYDARYGTTEGFWTTTQFVEAIYNGLDK